MQAWQRSFRAIANQLPVAGLEALRTALVSDDPRLLQGATTSPPPLQCVQDWPIESACAVAFAAWQGGSLSTVGEVEQAFARVCYAADQAMGEPAGVRYFLNAYDDWARAEMRTALLAEVNRVLAQRSVLAPSAA